MRIVNYIREWNHKRLDLRHRKKELKMREKIRQLCDEGNIREAIELVYNNDNRRIDWEHPQLINEKLQVLKAGLYYNNPLITRCVDKVQVKDYIAELGHPCRCAKTYGVYEHPEEIEWEKLPDQFVLKCNHGCGYNIIIDDKVKADKQNVMNILVGWLAEEYWVLYAEPQYKFINHRILAEEHLGDNINTYKFYCFNGEPKIMYISENGPRGLIDYDMYYDYYDMEFKWQDITLGNHLHYPEKRRKPDNWQELKSVAKQLAEAFPFVRVDLYDVCGEIYLSELTFMPTGGYMELKPERCAREWGEWLQL